MKTYRNRLLYAALVLAVLYFLFNAQAWLVRFPAYRHLYRGHPFYVPEGIKTSLQILRQTYTGAVFNTIIPRNTDLRDAHFDKKDIFSFNPRAAAAQAYAH